MNYESFSKQYNYKTISICFLRNAKDRKGFSSSVEITGKTGSTEMGEKYFQLIAFMA